MRGLTCVGDIVTDFSPITAAGDSKYAFEVNLGGTGANCAAAAAKLGLDTLLAGCLGDDFMGRHAREVLEQSGVDTSLLQTSQGLCSSHNFISLANGNRSFTFAIDGSAYPELSLNEECARKLLCTRMLYISGVNFAHEPINTTSRQLIVAAREAGIPMSIDFNYRQALYKTEENYRRHLLPLLRNFQIVKGSREDFQVLFGTDNLPDIAADILAQGPKLVVMTADHLGVSYATDSIYGSIPAIYTSVIDTTGAGDTLMGALLAQLDAKGGIDSINDRDLHAVIEYANAAAGIATQKLGAIPSMPTPAEVDALLDQLKTNSPISCAANAPFAVSTRTQTCPEIEKVG